MDCMRTQKLFRAYLKGKLSDRELKEFLDHVEKCPKCWGELEIYFAIYHVMYDKRDDGNYNFIEKLNLKIRMSREYLKKRYYYKVFRVALVFFAQMTLLVTAGTAYVKKHDMIPQDEPDGLPNVSLGSGWEHDYEDKPDNADTVLPFETMIRIEELPNETAAFEPEEIGQELLQLESDVILPAVVGDISAEGYGTVENVPAAGSEAVTETSAAGAGESSIVLNTEETETELSDPDKQIETELSDPDEQIETELSDPDEQIETELFDPDEQKKALAYTNSILYHVLGLEVPSESESEKETGQQ